MEPDIPYALLAKYLEEETTPEEEARVAEMLESNPQLGDQLAEMAALLHGNEELPPSHRVEVGTAWEKLQASVGLASNDKPANTKADTANETAGRSIQLYRWWPAAAALLLLGIVGGWLVGGTGNGGQVLTFTNQGTEPLPMLLPDGSQVVLREGAKVSYNEERFIEDRRLFVTGELFVEQVSQGGSPFKVVFTDLEVEAPAEAKFLAVNPANQAEQRVAVANGQVMLRPLGQSPGWELSCLSGQQASMVAEHQFLSVTDNTDLNYLSWYSGDLAVPQVSLPTLLRQLADELEMPLGKVDPAYNDTLVSGYYEDYDAAELLYELLKHYKAELKTQDKNFDIIYSKSI